MNFNQALVVLGEQALKLRLLEDENENMKNSLQEQADAITQLTSEVESLTEEKKTLLLDVTNLEKALQRRKERQTGRRGN